MNHDALQLGFFEKKRTPEDTGAAYRGDWETPLPEFIQIQDAGFPFYLDVAASAWNTKCLVYYTEQENGLLQDWEVPEGAFWWCNPDFRLWLEFIEKAYEEMLKGNEGIMLLPANTDRPMFSEIEKRGLRVLFWGTDTPGVSGRINFIDPTSQKRQSNFKGSILVAFTNKANLPPINGRKWWGVQ